MNIKGILMLVDPYYQNELVTIYNGDCLDVLPELAPVELIIADPPYYKTKGDFDFIWKTFQDYLEEVKLWAIECDRILTKNGTLVWFGDEKNIAYSQIIFDEYFGLLNSLVWWKYNLRGGAFGTAGGDGVRSFPICTERILVYSNDTYNLTNCVLEIRDYIRAEILKSKGKVILKDVNSALGTATNGGGVASACLSLSKTEPTMLTKEMYVKLQEWCNPYLNKEYEYLRREYEDLRREYEDLRREFDNKYNLTEVLQYNTDIKNEFKHETVKPFNLMHDLIETCSRSRDTVLDPFIGSGTTAVACMMLNRKCIGIELEEKYCEIAATRCETAKTGLTPAEQEAGQQTLFEDNR